MDKKFQVIDKMLNADVTKTDRKGQTVLMYAAGNDDLADFLPILVKAGAVMDQQDSSGMTALAHAVSADCHECVYWLLDAGASVNICDHLGKSPLAHAASIGSRKFTLWLLQFGADVTKVDGEGRTVLMQAARHDCLTGLLPLLLKAGAHVDHQDFSGMTALTHAVTTESHECVLRLLDSGASVNICDCSGKTPLHYLVSLNNKSWIAGDCLRKLLSKQPDVNAKDNNGMTPLMHVARKPVNRKKGTCACPMTMMLEHGADINTVDNLGQTALFLCLQVFLDVDRHLGQNQNPGIPSLSLHYDPAENIKLLLDKGANLGNRKLTVGRLYRLTETNYDLDLLKLQVGDEVDLRVQWGKFVSVIQKGIRKILQFLIINKVVPSLPALGHTSQCHHIFKEASSVLEESFKFGNIGITKYLIATCYLSSNDLVFSSAESLDRSIVSSNSLEVITMVRNLRSQPWPLVKLCFVSVSTAFGASPERQERVKNSQLPAKLQRMLLFQEPWSRLCVHQWDKIPLTFNPEEYHKLPRPRPLLYHWPVGRALVPCDCGECNGTMYKYKLEKGDSDNDDTSLDMLTD